MVNWTGRSESVTKIHEGLENPRHITLFNSTSERCSRLFGATQLAQAMCGRRVLLKCLGCANLQGQQARHVQVQRCLSIRWWWQVRSKSASSFRQNSLILADRSRRNRKRSTVGRRWHKSASASWPVWSGSASGRCALQKRCLWNPPYLRVEAWKAIIRKRCNTPAASFPRL